MRDDVNIMFEEYKLILGSTQHYFDFMYRNMSMAIVFFTAAITFALSDNTVYLARIFLLLYMIPIFGYIFGLLYFYCISALAKLGYNAVYIEQRLKRRGLIGHIGKNKEYKIGYFLSYGTTMMLYITVPLVSIIIGNGVVDKDQNVQLFFHKWVAIEKIVIEIFPWIGYFIYILFSLLIFIETGKLMIQTNKEI